MNASLFSYQNELDGYVDDIKSVFDQISRGVQNYCDGFAGKIVMELGVGFQLPHGGLSMPLAMMEGAKQVIGIDITNPELHAADPAKIAFWKVALAKLGVECQGLEDGRVYFSSIDTLHFDDFFAKVTLLQMSASNMWFKDSMFDLAISNAVFEHVKQPQEVLSELYRVLKPGGSAFIHWNPYTGLRMGGHDIGIPYYYPWSHLRLSRDKHIEKLRNVLNDPHLLETANPREHAITTERADYYKNQPELLWKHMDDDLNKMRVNEFLDFARAEGFEIIHSGYHFEDDHRQFLTPEIHNELAAYTEDELLTVFHSAALRKPV